MNQNNNFDGAVCYHHPRNQAVGRCDRCGRSICKDCAEVYTVVSGEYANKSLCYDCCQELVKENIALLRKQRGKIIGLFVATFIGMVAGLILGILSRNWILTIFTTLWIGSFWSWIRGVFVGWWKNPRGRSAAGFFGALIGAGIIAPILTR